MHCNSLTPDVTEDQKVNNSMIEKADESVKWTIAEIQSLLDMPFNDLMFEAQTVHRKNFDPNAVQVSTLKGISYSAAISSTVQS